MESYVTLKQALSLILTYLNRRSVPLDDSLLAENCSLTGSHALLHRFQGYRETWACVAIPNHRLLMQVCNCFLPSNICECVAKGDMSDMDDRMQQSVVDVVGSPAHTPHPTRHDQMQPNSPNPPFFSKFGCSRLASFLTFHIVLTSFARADFEVV